MHILHIMHRTRQEKGYKLTVGVIYFPCPAPVTPTNTPKKQKDPFMVLLLVAVVRVIDIALLKIVLCE